MSTTPATVLAAGPSNVRDADRWARVQARDRAADGTFFYGVTSTGVFCRPSCPSRRPRPDRVRFFETPELATAAGFRPCRRCRPGESPGTTLDATIRRVARYLDRHADEPVQLRRLAELAALSPSHLQRQFKRALGLSPREYQAARRAQRFRHELRAGRDVTAAIYEAGYGSPSRVYESVPTGRGLTPGAYRRGGQGERIGYAIVPCALGRLLVAATDKGICAVKLGDRDSELERDLAREFPRATLDRDTGAMRREWIEDVVDRLNGGAAATDLPLDVRGTAFQWRVWRELERIPHGATRSYSDIARSIGHPEAVRAVARACASNPVAIVVPCHRVLPKQGGLGGYRWGVGRKQALLDRERRK